MATEMLTATPLTADQPGLCIRDFERIARAVGRGRARVAAEIVGAADELLQCDAAVLLRPTHEPGVHAVTRPLGAGEGAVHERWELGPEAPRLFDRPGHAADGWREPWSGLRMRLRGLNLRSWASVPLRCEGAPEPLGALVICRCSEDRPAGRMHRLPDFALSASAALAAAIDDLDATQQPNVAGRYEHLERVGNLSFGVSHALGNIFGAILGNLHFLETTAHSDEQRALLSRIARSTTQGVDLMHDLQSFSHIPTGAGMGVVELSEVAGEVAALLMRLCGHWPGVRAVEVDAELAGPAPVWGDAQQLRESVVALVFNALRAVGRDGRIVLRTRHEGRTSEIQVIDDGPGMTDEVMRRATEPFFTTRPALHEGLGLTLARAVAVAHRGALTLHRGAMGGTEVALRLPQDPPAHERPEMPPGAAERAAAGYRKGHAR